MLKFSMLILPIVFILIGYLIYRKKFRIDKELFDKIIDELKARGDINK